MDGDALVMIIIAILALAVTTGFALLCAFLIWLAQQFRGK